jgi:hypothetical protein
MSTLSALAQLADNAASVAVRTKVAILDTPEFK